MKNKGIVFYFTGTLLIVIALCLSVYNCYSDFNASLFSKDVINKLNLDTHQLENNDSSSDLNNLAKKELFVEYPDIEMPVKKADEYDYLGVIVIPSINIELPVMSECSPELLWLSPCRYYGSVYQNNMVIAAHNYSSHFGNIMDLDEKDMVYFIDTENRVFSYYVQNKETLRPSESEQMCTDESDLTLFTCTPGGQYRATVRCCRSEG